MYNLNAESSLEPISQTTPIIMKSSISQKANNPEENTTYSSWLGFPALAVFFGRRSKSMLVNCNLNSEGKTYSGECLVGHHLGQLWRVREACSTPHHCGWRVEDDEEWYGSSCCHELRYRPTQEFQLLGTLERQRGRQGHLKYMLEMCHLMTIRRHTGTNTLSVVSLSEKTVDTTNWECETSLGWSTATD
jgi:hypothetical protein